MTLNELFEIAADAFEIGDHSSFESILAEAGDAACWYWVIGPERGRPKKPIAIPYYAASQWYIVRRIYGTSILGDGYVYAPYIPLTTSQIVYTTGTIVNTTFTLPTTTMIAATMPFYLEEGTVSKNTLMRYATTAVNPTYYGTLIFGSGSGAELGKK